MNGKEYLNRKRPRAIAISKAENSAIDRLIIGLVFLLALSLGLFFANQAEGGQGLSYDNYNRVLEARVDSNGLVNYKKIKSSPSRLEAFIESVAALEPATYRRWPESEKIAFWINVYNAITIQSIVDNYPIQSSFSKSLAYPKNSIRQIPGVWDKKMHTVMGRQFTLNDIEHKILRKKFNEPRIHIALNCASMGCPPLLGEPYTGVKLNIQFAAQTRRFLEDPQNFRIDSRKRKVYLSSIFKWFGRDFVRKYGNGSRDSKQAVFNFVSLHTNADNRAFLQEGNLSVEYLKYDWSLNEKK
jgi:hypothetical protein